MNHPLLDECNIILYEIGMGGEPIAYDNATIIIDGDFWGSVKWYDTWLDATRNWRFRFFR